MLKPPGLALGHVSQSAVITPAATPLVFLQHLHCVLHSLLPQGFCTYYLLCLEYSSLLLAPALTYSITIPLPSTQLNPTSLQKPLLTTSFPTRLDPIEPCTFLHMFIQF